MINRERQKELIEFIRSFIAKNGFPPAVQEIADGIGISLVVTHGYLSRARKKGLVTWEPFKSRTIRLMEVSHVRKVRDHT